MACLAADLGKVHSVYLLPMANGLDQYLANRITGSGKFEVVADPKKADAIFTDKIGEAFEGRLKELFPPPAEKKEPSAVGQSAASQPAAASPSATSQPAAASQPAPAPRSSGFGRSKGTIFLVDISSRSVLWSAYEPPKNTTPREMDRTAQRIVERLTSPSKGK
jgi:hypothetical protein